VDLSNTKGDLILIDADNALTCACCGIVMHRLEADSMIDPLQTNVPLRGNCKITYPKAATPGNYLINCKYQSDLSKLHACFVLCYLTQFKRQLGASSAINSRSQLEGMHDAK
jgi:hypothetical protein